MNTSSVDSMNELLFKMKFVFIGAGQMSKALIKGFVQSGLIDAKKIIAVDPNGNQRDSVEALGVSHSRSLVMSSDSDTIVVLGVKPQIIPSVLYTLKPLLSPRHLVISVAAGVNIDSMEKMLEPSARVIRVMPNTPCLVGACTSAFSVGTSATSNDSDVVMRLMESVGVVLKVPESKLDAVIGVSGSGPAYVFVMIEAMADGGVKMGLSRAQALKLAAHTFMGAAKMVLDDSTGGPAALKDAVASPGGTTIAALHALERGGVRCALIDAVEASAKRSMELQKNSQ